MDALQQAQEGNNIVVGNPASMRKADISIKGTNNVLFLEPGAAIQDGSIVFEGDNSLVYISNGTIRAHIAVGNDACLYVGEKSYFHTIEPMRICVDDHSAVCLGNELLSSIAVRINTAGEHKVLCIGNHTWLCHGATVQGNSKIAANTIVAARARLNDCITESFTCWGGDNRRLMTDVIYSRVGTRKLSREQRRKRDQLTKEDAAAIISEQGIDLSALAQSLLSFHDAQSRLGCIQSARDENVYTPLNDTKFVGSEKLGVLNITQLFKSPKNVQIGKYKTKNRASQLHFDGYGNVLIVEDGVTLEGCDIKFQGDNGLLYLSASSKPYHLVISVQTESSVFIGHENEFAAKGARSHLNPSEGQAIVVGNGNRFGRNVWVRTSDQHVIYSLNTLERINQAEPVVISNGSSLGDECLVQKGAIIDARICEAGCLVLRSKESHQDAFTKLATDLSTTSSMALKQMIVQRFAKKNA